MLLIATVLAGAWISSQVTVIDNSEARRAFDYDPGASVFLIAFFLALVSLIIWYVAPGVDGVLFRSMVLLISGVGLVLFIVYSVRRFQRHLEVEP